MDRLRITRNAFSMLLGICPVLDHIDICNTVLESSVFTDNYQHARLSKLTAPIEQVFRVDPILVNAPSLLVHFPNLSQWETWQASPTPNVDIKIVNKEIRRCCPSCTAIHVRPSTLPIASMLVYGFKALTEICHQDTLTAIMTTLPRDFHSNQLFTLEDHLATSSWIVQFILRQCPRLKIISLPTFAMNMSDVNEIEWMCDDLEVLHVRIKGLETKEQINEVLKRWVDGKKAKVSTRKANLMDKSNPTANDSQHSLSSNPALKAPIEILVARHLLKFEKLHTVWLGHQTLFSPH
ncbi:hypothetical protein BGZ65_008968 [Modicella reniformis]|uniref:Uncharacterized protein n=1 Tax=Modicella reniformis TaxID=1440133 RepID=A0A9P6IIP6_9FUNG|nr:hypothetical protein BGZ65_008968 [Modicella reniformis]